MRVPSFEWDADKDGINQKKHGVSFDQAQRLLTIPSVLFSAISPMNGVKSDGSAWDSSRVSS